MKSDTQQEIADKKYIGNRLRILRESRGISQEELAEALGEKYTRKHIWQFETGGDHMRIGTLFAVCDVLEVRLEELVPERMIREADEMMLIIDELTQENRSRLREYAEFLLSRQGSA